MFENSMQLTLKDRVTTYPIPVLLGEVYFKRQNGIITDREYEQASSYILGAGHNTITLYDQIKDMPRYKQEYFCLLNSLFGPITLDDAASDRSLAVPLDI